MKNLGLILALMILSLQGWAQGSLPYFNVLYDHEGFGVADWGAEVLSFSDSTYVVAGTTQDTVDGAPIPYLFWQTFLDVVDEHGTILSKTSYGTPFQRFLGQDNHMFVHSIEGGYAVAGIWQRWTPDYSTTYFGTFLLKVDSLLDSTWMALDSGSMIAGQGVTVKTLVQAPDSGYILAGYDNQGRIFLSKFDISGVKLWRRLVSPVPMHFYTFNQLASSDFLFAGSSPSIESYLMRVDQQGIVVWDSSFSNVNPNYQNFAMAKQLSNGGYFVIDAAPDNTSTYDMHCMWWNASMQLIGEYTVELPQYQYPRNIIEMSDGSIVLAGPTGTDANPSISHRSFILKFDPGRNLSWLRFYYWSQPLESPMKSCALAHDGGFLLTGSSHDTSGTSIYEDTWILKVDSVGCPFPNCGPSMAVKPSETESADWIEAFPNPASNRIHLRCLAQGIQEKAVIHLLSIDGRAMEEVQLPMGFTEIDFDLALYPAGMYIWEYRDALGHREAGRFEVVH